MPSGMPSTWQLRDIEIAQDKFASDLDFVASKVHRIRKCKSKIETISDSLETLADDFDLRDNKRDDDKANDNWKFLSDFKRQVVEQLRDLQSQLYEHFDKTLGGIKAKHEKQPLKLPRDLNKVTSREIIDAIKIFLVHQANEYW